MGLHKRNAIYHHQVLEWNKAGDVEDNDFKPIVDRILNSKQSIVINGKAGCGIILPSLAPTNKACGISNGKTLHKITISHSCKSLMKIKWQYIIVDEMSMLNEHLYTFFITLHQILISL